MLAHTDLKKGVKIILDNYPCEIIESSFMFKARGSSVIRVRVKNLITGNVVAKTFRPSDTFEEAELRKISIKFLYYHRDKFFFCQKENPANRFDLTKEQIGQQAEFLKSDQIVEGMIFERKVAEEDKSSSSPFANARVINISLPIKINLKVIEAPPGVKGNRAEAGTKTITLETKTKINAPLFIKEGDIIEINTESGEYVRRLGG